MSGTDRKLLVDTNILIYLDGGSENAAKALVDRNLFLSFISEIQLLGTPALSKNKIRDLEKMMDSFEVIEFSNNLKRKTIELKQKLKIKVPDAIIAATAIEYNLPLLTSDKSFLGIPELYCVLFEV